MIVTTRARYILLLAAAVAFVGLVSRQVFLARLGTATLLWIGVEWILFRLRADFFHRRVTASRQIKDRQGEARILWTGRPANVSTQIECRPFLRFLPATLATIHDLQPMATDKSEEETVGLNLSFGPTSNHTIDYRFETKSIGAIQFTGLRCVLHDQNGFFQAERFINLPQKMRVLPLSQPLRTQSTFRKSRNAMPPPGIHSISKAGAGTELLEIRDYVPGDPPRSIAWKVSARRGSLMTKQYETEVPIRCQMFVDMSPSARVGYPGPCMAQRLAEVAASVSNLLVSNRDAVGMSVFDGKEVRLLKCSANRRAHLQMMDMLSNCMDQPIEPVDTPVAGLIRRGFDVARVRYPEAVHYVQHKSFSLLPRLPKRRMHESMAMLLCNHFGLDEWSMGELAVNDRSMAYWLQRFLADHQIPYTSTRYSSEGEYLFADQHKIEQLSRMLTHASLRSRDSELFLIFAELTDYDYDLAPLIQAAKMASARQHRVAVLCAWPPGLPLINGEISLDAVLSQVEFGIDGLLVARQRAGQYGRLRSELGKLGIPVAAAIEDTAIPLIATQLDIVRSGRAVA